MKTQSLYQGTKACTSADISYSNLESHEDFYIYRYDFMGSHQRITKQISKYITDFQVKVYSLENNNSFSG